MKPSDCVDMSDTQSLACSGIAINENEIEVIPPNVIVTIGRCKISISQKVFKKMSEWYLTEQEEREK